VPRRRQLDIDLEVRSGAPGDHVVDAADTEHADPIAMACRNISIPDKPRAATARV
jgi:nucleotide-binding universal stress UspA family protein